MTAESGRGRSRGASTEEVWIAFAGRTEMAWLRLFRPGFRHCFAALADAVLRWADESATLAQYVVYGFGPRTGDGPPALDEAYRANGERIARHRLALAAYRLVALLESRLGR